jgi:hypothetical protein
MYLEYNNSWGVVLVFWFWREIVFGVTYLFSVQYTCAVVSVFWSWWEIVLKMRTHLYYKRLKCRRHRCHRHRRCVSIVNSTYVAISV